MFGSAPPPLRTGSDDEVLIQRAPRAVPGAVRRRLLFGGPVHQMGWLFLGIGLVFSGIFVADSELWTPLIFSGQTDHVDGRVTGIERTSASEHDAIIYGLRYSYEWNGARHEGISYTFHPNAEPGAPVTVELVRARPEVSRVQGLRYRRFSPVVSLVLIFPIIGFGMVMHGIRRGLRNTRLLAQGQPAWGTLVNKRKTGVKINEVPVYELTFRYDDRDGREQQGSIRTLHTAPVEDERRERLLYDPRAPRHIALLDDLGRDVSVDERGCLVSQRRSFPVMILPVLTCTAIIAFLLL